MPHNYANDFGPFDDTTWLNCAHQGPLPRVAVTAAEEAIAWKVSPHHLATPEPFTDVPQRLRRALGRLLQARTDDVILANSASYGMHLLANTYPWRSGDEVLLVEGDFPSCILPWRLLERRGVRLRFLQPSSGRLEADDVIGAAGPDSRLLCTTWVHSFTGRAIDLNAIGDACRQRDIAFLVNTSQALGTRPLNVTDTPVDALVNVGFKWLCGPYGTGFCWMRPELRERLMANKAYWLAVLTADDLAAETIDTSLRSSSSARDFDIFGTANFLNFKPWTASLEYLLDCGIENVAAHNGQLVERFIQGLDDARFRLLSPADGDQRSTLVFVSHHEPDKNREFYQHLTSSGVYPAFRKGALRFSPHLHNTPECIDRALGLLNGSG